MCPGGALPWARCSGQAAFAHIPQCVRGLSKPPVRIMTQAELRAEIRDLVISSALPPVLPGAEKIAPGQGPRVMEWLLGFWAIDSATGSRSRRGPRGAICTRLRCAPSQPISIRADCCLRRQTAGSNHRSAPAADPLQITIHCRSSQEMPYYADQLIQFSNSI
jgi:hypothetical protein